MMASGGAADEWRSVLSAGLFRRVRQTSSNPYDARGLAPILKRRNYYLERLAHRLIQVAERKRPSASWYQACDLLALTSAARWGDGEALGRLREAFDRQLEAEGRWKYPLTKSFQLMQGYSLAFLCGSDGADRYRRALAEMVVAFEGLPRSATGTILYTKGRREIFIDTIGMLCPCLAAAGRILDRRDLIAAAMDQIDECLANNLHTETHLPYHGYYAGGPYQLGWGGWGRGTGWYMIGLVDVAAELKALAHPFAGRLAAEIMSVSGSLCRFQRASGHWGEQIMVDDAPDDSSATAFIAYALLRALNEGLLAGQRIEEASARAAAALAAATTPSGRILKASGEALGLGQYGRSSQPQPWADGLAAAASFELAGLKARNAVKGERGS